MTEAARSGRATLGLGTLLALGINGTVGVGIFFAPAEVTALVPGVEGPLVYLIAALGLLPVAVVFGRLGREYAEDGGPYVWARAAFGPTAAFFLGWLTYVSSVLSAAAVVSGVGQQLMRLTRLDVRFSAIACMACLAALVGLGLRMSALGLRLITLLKLTPLLALVVVGLLKASLGEAPGLGFSAMPGSAGRAALLVVFALQGFEVVPVLAGHSREGLRVQHATLLTLTLCALLYMGLQWVSSAAASATGDVRAPLASAAAFYGGPSFGRLVDAGQLVSALGIAFGQLVTTPRYLATLGRPDGLGAWVGAVHVSGTPRRALLITTLLIALLVLLGNLQSLFVLSSVAVLSQYCAAALSWLRLSFSGVLARDRALTWLSLLALVTCASLASYATSAELFTTLAVEVVGVVLLVARRRLLLR